MAYVPDQPVRVREVLEDGTAHDITVSRVEDDDSITVLDNEPAVDENGYALPPVYYSKEDAKKLKTPSKAAESKSAAKAEEEQK